MSVYYGRAAPPVREPGGRLSVALVFPGRAATALSSLGWQIVYRLLEARPELAPERFFLDLPGLTGSAGRVSPPLSEDAQRSLDRFPVIAFSLGFEEDLPVLPAALAATGLPRRTADRPDWPLVLVGGPLAFLNPAPLAPGADLIWVGEAEAGLADLLVLAQAAYLAGRPKTDWLAEVADRPGVLAPGRTVLPARRAVQRGAPGLLAEPGHSCFISSEAEFRDMLLVEVNRGCPYGCRFCAAGFIYRPPRQARLQDLQRIVEETAPPKVGLVGTALTDWPDLLPFLRWLKEREVKFSLSSLRADGITRPFLEFLRKSGVRTLTLALEGASPRLRRAANKKLDEDDFLRAVSLAAEFAVNHLKLYLIVGWPGEEEADHLALAEFLGRIEEARQKGAKGKGLEHVTLSLSSLVSKPWTPFQWAPMASEERLKEIIARVKRLVKPLKGWRAEADSPAAARLQGVLARGDESLYGLLEQAADQGLRRALKEWPGDPAAILDRQRDRDEPFPWEMIDIGVGRDLLWREWERFQAARATPVCPAQGCQGCDRCGMHSWLGGAGQEAGAPAAPGADDPTAE